MGAPSRIETERHGAELPLTLGQIFSFEDLQAELSPSQGDPRGTQEVPLDVFLVFGDLLLLHLWDGPRLNASIRMAAGSPPAPILTGASSPGPSTSRLTFRYPFAPAVKSSGSESSSHRLRIACSGGDKGWCDGAALNSLCWPPGC